MLFGKKETRAYHDLHCHILPGMDDGSKSSDMSVEMLQEMIRQGCEGIIATSHYYDHESIEEFLRRREDSYQRFCAKLAQNGMGAWTERIGLGAEAAYHPYLAGDEDLDKLCFRNPITGESTNYLLLEMPFMKWTPQVLRDVQTIINERGLTPIIAHLERFPEYTSEDSIEELLGLDVIIQMNSGALLHRSSKRRALRMVKNGITQVLGTDSHNTDTRRPNMTDGVTTLIKNGLTTETDEILANNAQIYAGVMAG